eukprot:1142665-Pelagomonas_calceolata.AAC.8
MQGATEHPLLLVHEAQCKEFPWLRLRMTSTLASSVSRRTTSCIRDDLVQHPGVRSGIVARWPVSSAV